MRYFIYLSQAKVDMLYPQVPGARTGSNETEVGVDLKAFRAAKRHRSNEPDLYRRLSQVEDWILTNDDASVGTIDDPAHWIYCRGRLEGVLLADPEGKGLPKQAVVFAAESDVGNCLLLGGSRYNLTLEDNLVQESSSYSIQMELLRILHHYASFDGSFDEDPDYRPNPGNLSQRDSLRRGILSVYELWAMIRERRFSSQSFGTCELLAKRLLTDTVDNRTVSLATPLSVWLADD